MKRYNWDKLTPGEQQEIIRSNNPGNKPTGVFTGRCVRCGSADLWDDRWGYGCNCCGAMNSEKFESWGVKARFFIFGLCFGIFFASLLFVAGYIIFGPK
jgi:hypothetical protein